jgi:ABC-type bacteriocin/lantibiotic exporter with double-glycine peptidase domain
MGTTLQSLSDVAKKHGFTPKGLELTQKGLVKQQFPLIALVAPGHYVIVEKASMDEVTIWDSNMAKVKKPLVRDVPIKEWSEMWKGIVLALG